MFGYTEPEKFHKWQNDTKAAELAQIKASEERLMRQVKGLAPPDPTILLLTPYDKRMLAGMKVAV